MEKTLLTNKSICKLGASACLILDRYIQDVSEIHAKDKVEVLCTQNKIIITKE